MKLCFIDTETRTRTPIERGNDLYTRDAECLIVTFAIDDKPTILWEPWKDKRIPPELQEAIDTPGVLFIAHNAVFDMFILLRALGIKIALKRWRCTRAQAYAHGLPGSLELLGVVLGLPQDHQKLVDDGKLIHTFCVPQAASDAFIEPYDAPQDWERFCNYAVRDTDALRDIYWRLPSHNYQGINLEFWIVNQLENERGFQFDAELAQQAIDFLKLAKTKTDAAMFDASFGNVHAATQRNRLLKYLQQTLKVDIQNLKAAEIREWLEHDDIDPVVRFLLETRLEAGKSSGSKYSRGVRCVGPRNRMRCTVQFNGAGRTGRNSGKLFQPHNMARPVLAVRRDSGKIELSPVKAEYIDEVILPGIRNQTALCNDLIYGGPNEACALALRHVITAAPGNVLVVADWKNIESRVLAWIADEVWKLEAYRANDAGTGVDLYKLLFAQFFGVHIDSVNDTERQSGKVSELAFGFGGGVGALVTMAAGYQMDLTPLANIVLPRATNEQLDKAYKAWRRAFLTGEDYELEAKVYQACDVLKQTYRESNNRINQLKHDLDHAIKNSVREPNSTVYEVAKCKVWSTGQWLIIQLPSSRRLLYANPRLEEEIVEDPDTGNFRTQEYVSYMTARGKTWRRERAWSGLYLENIVQAIANDVLRGAIVRIHKDTLRTHEVAEYLDKLPEFERTAICLDVHDEVALDVPRNSYSLKRLIAMMTEEFWWSKGLPLAAEGWIGPRYGKRK